MTTEQKGRAAEQRVTMGEVSRARECLTGAAVAPGNEVPVHLDRKTFLASLKRAPRRGGWMYEHSEGILDDTDTSFCL